MTKDNEMDVYYTLMRTKSIVELAAFMNTIRAELDQLKEKSTSLQKEYDALRLNIIPEKMDEQDITNITIEGVGRLGLTSDVYASIDDQEKAFTWLRENRRGDIIKETINSSSLKATIKEIIKNGREIIPPGLFKITPFTRASITKR
jgi:hypothetical protein